MATAKDIRVAPIKSADARAFVQRWHYSGKAYPKSQLHLGAFIDGMLIGVMQYGDPLVRAKVLPLVRGTKWNDMLELNRMAMIDATPPNTESRFIAISARIIRKTYPNMEWLLSFSDGCQCGDGTIYRAAGFLLTGIKKNKTILRAPNGYTFTDIGFKTSTDVKARALAACGVSRWISKEPTGLPGVVDLPGFQLRYILPLKPGVRERLTVPILPYTEIIKRGAGMYLGKPRHAPEASSDALHNPVQRGQGSTDPGAP